MNCSVFTADEHCASAVSELLITDRRHGYLSPASLAQLSSRLVAMQSVTSIETSLLSATGHPAAGTAHCPWSLLVKRGQRLNISLTLLPARTTLTSRRDAFVDADDDVIERSIISVSGHVSVHSTSPCSPSLVWAEVKL